MISWSNIYYLKQFLDFPDNQFFNFLGEDFGATFDELVVDVLQAFDACLFIALSNLAEESSGCSQRIMLKRNVVIKL